MREQKFVTDLHQSTKRDYLARMASSSSVYGVKEEKNVHEGMSLEPLTDYSKFKADCEKILADQYEYTCQDKSYILPGRMGSIEDRSFKGFWFSEENQKFFKSFIPSVQCGHHCVGHAKNLAIHDYLALDYEHVNSV